MNGINDIMDNSKYYSSSSFLGIHGDKKFTRVSNDGFFNASSLEIEITETEAISVCKTVAMDSNYTISDATENGKTKNTYSEVNDTRSNTHDEQTYDEESNSKGKVTVKGENKTTDKYDLTTDLENEIKKEWVHSINETVHGEIVFQGGVDVEAGAGAQLSNTVIHGGIETHSGLDVENENKQEIVVIPKKETQKGKVESTEKLDYTEENVDKTNVKGSSSGDSSTIEHGLTSGEDNGVTYSHANEMAVGVGYGVNYQYGNDHSLTLGVKRVFNERDDKEVKNVGWKLCEYVVKIPYYIEAVKTDSTGEEKVLYGQYVNYNLLNGVSRVFANGYIEHWYTGELVTYADFFDGFIIAQELVDKAKEQQAAKVPKEGE